VQGYTIGKLSDVIEKTKISYSTGIFHDFFGQITKTSNERGYTIGKESDGIDKMNRTVI